MKKIIFFLFSLGISIAALSQNEKLKIAWPEDWKVGSEQKTNTQVMVEYIPKNENVNEWSILGSTTIYKGKASVPIEAPMNITFSGAKKTAINPTLTLIDEKVSGENRWVLFKIEAEGFTNNKIPESQLYYIIEGENDLFLNFVTIKKSTLSKEFVDHWSEVFKASQFTK